MKYPLAIFFVNICLVVLTPLYAQVDSNFVSDTSDTYAKQAIDLLIKSDSLSNADSFNKSILRKQLDNLEKTEIEKRELLENELAEIKYSDSLQKTNLLAEVAILQENSIRYPVVIYKDTLFLVFTKIGSFTPSERAKVITERLQNVYREFFLKSDSLTILDDGQSVDIYFRNDILLSITELDALWYQKSKIEIATDYERIILADIAEYKNNWSLIKLLKEIGLALLVIIVQLLLIKGLNYIFRARINKFLWNKRDVWFKGVKFKNYEILNSSRETSVIIFIIKIIRITLIVLLLYLTIPIIFSIFPPTKRIAVTLFGYILDPVKNIGISVLNYIPKLFTIIVIIVITRYVLKFLRFLSFEIENEKIKIPGFFPDWAKSSYNIIKMLILAFMFVVIYQYLPGSNSEVFKGVSIFIGVLFSLGSSSIIGNMVAGLVITYMRPFKIGDHIKIKEVIGNIVEKTPFVIRVITPKKELITIPNSNVLSSNVVNYSNSKLQGGLVVHTTVTIGYDAPWREVHQILINAAKNTANLNMEIAPFVLQTSLDDFYVSYQLNAHTNEPNKQPKIYSELHQNIQDGFNKAGIEILSPHYRSARDGNTMAVPKEYLPEDYEVPGFKINKDE